MPTNKALPLVSVAIPCYNHENYVQDCIKSVINQSYENIELIIIDDGSKDNSVQKIQEMIPACQKRFARFEFRTRQNKGLSSTLNEALDWCEGEYFSAIASDDCMLENKTSLQINYILGKISCAGIFGGIEIIDENKKAQIRLKRPHVYKFKDILLHNHELPAPTQLLRMDKLKETGGFLEGLPIEDWYMWLKITQNGLSLDYIPHVLARYRRHDSNTSKKYDLMLSARLSTIDLFSDPKNVALAKGYAYLVAANDYLTCDKIKSFQYYKKYLCTKGYSKVKLFFSIKSLKYIVKYSIC